MHINKDNLVSISVKIGDYGSLEKGTVSQDHAFDFFKKVLLKNAKRGKASEIHSEPKYAEKVGEVVKVEQYEDSIDDEGVLIFRDTLITRIYILKDIEITPEKQNILPGSGNLYDVFYHVTEILHDSNPLYPLNCGCWIKEKVLTKEDFETLLKVKNKKGQ